jgi:uncharacterized UPF0160 family protein
MQKENIMVTDKNREEIIQSYVQRLLDDMDFDTIYTFVYETLVDSKDLMDNIALENEIKDYYPELLDEIVQ